MFIFRHPTFAMIMLISLKLNRPNLTCLFSMTIFVTGVLQVTNVEARRLSGEIDTKLDTVYLTRFVFEPNKRGIFKYDVKYPKYIGTPEKPKENDYYRIVIYNDFPSQWPFVRANEDKLTCLEKQRIAIEGGMVMLSLSPEHGCEEVMVNETQVHVHQYIHCQGDRSWKDYSWARWWFVTIQNCGTHRTPGLQLSYDFTLTNGDDILTKHFSADEKILLPTNIAFLTIYCGVLAVSCTFRYILKKSRMLHSTYQLFVWSVIVHFVGLICLVISQLNFAKTGLMSFEWLQITGHVLTTISMLIFILDSILIAKGFTLTRARISTSGCIKITIIMVLFTIASAVQYLYQHVLADDRDVFNVNQTPAAYAEIALRVFGLAWVFYAIVISIQHRPDKGRFYFYFGLFFIIWFVSEPIMICITNNNVASHARAQIVNCANQTVILMGHLFWLGLFFPKRYNKLFPYHMRANQVGILQIGEAEDTHRRYSLDRGKESNVACETVAATARPVPRLNNFFPGGRAAKVQKQINLSDLPVPRTDWNIFRATGPVPQTEVAQVPQNVCVDREETENVPVAPILGEEIESQPLPTRAVRAWEEPENQPVLATVREESEDSKGDNESTMVSTFEEESEMAEVEVESVAVSTIPKSQGPPPVCKDFSLFLATSVQ